MVKGRKIHVVDLNEIKSVNQQEATHTKICEPIEDVQPEPILEDESTTASNEKPLPQTKDDEPKMKKLDEQSYLCLL